MKNSWAGPFCFLTVTLWKHLLNWDLHLMRNVDDFGIRLQTAAGPTAWFDSDSKLTNPNGSRDRFSSEDFGRPLTIQLTRPTAITQLRSCNAPAAAARLVAPPPA